MISYDHYSSGKATIVIKNDLILGDIEGKSPFTITLPFPYGTYVVKAFTQNGFYWEGEISHYKKNEIVSIE